MNKIEIQRKNIHLLFGLTLVVLLHYNFITVVHLILLLVIAAALFLATKYQKIPFMDWILENFERPEVRKSFPGKGTLFYILGIVLSLLLFPKDIALASVIILAIGDSIPNLVGMQFRKIKHPFSNKKFLEGVFAGIVLSFLVAMIFVKWYEALIAATVAIFIESIDKRFEVDDNIIVPVIAGYVIMLIRWLPL